MAQDFFQSPDYFQVEQLFSEEHLLIRDAVRQWVKKEVSPIIETCAQQARFPKQILNVLAELGCFGPFIPEKYGGNCLDYLTYGLMMQELERGDSGIRSTASVQGSLVMFPIFKFGSETQKKKYLPALAKGELMGCFGLTEPDHGSDPGNMVTHFEEKGNFVELSGSKMWISNAPL